MNGFLFDILQTSCLNKPWYESGELVKKKKKDPEFKSEKKKLVCFL